MILQEIELFTDRLQELQQFYVEKLGFKLLNSTPSLFELQCGHSVLRFVESPDSCYYHYAFNIPSFQGREAQIWLKNHVEILKNGTEELIDFSNWNAEALYFFDPAGNIVEFIARKNLAIHSDQPFGIESILGISEMGFPTEDINAQVTKLEKEIGLEHYWGNRTSFSAVGDEHGLIILVNYKERKWFPTEVSPKPFPLKIRLEQEGRQFNLSLP